MNSLNHEKADAFRKRVKFATQRQVAISEMLQKDEFDASDEVRLQVLFQKKQYIVGCEDAYALLIDKVRKVGVPKLEAKITQFARKLGK